MKTISELKEVTKKYIKSDTIVIIHNGKSDDHYGEEDCWCNPIVMSGKEFIETSFDF